MFLPIGCIMGDGASIVCAWFVRSACGLRDERGAAFADRDRATQHSCASPLRWPTRLTNDEWSFLLVRLSMDVALQLQQTLLTAWAAGASMAAVVLLRQLKGAHPFLEGLTAP